MGGKKSELVLRVLSAAVLLPLVIWVVLAGERRIFGGVALLAGALALHEYAAMLLPRRPARERWAVVLVGAAFSFVVYVWPGFSFAATLAAVVVLGFVQLFGADDVPSAGARFGISIAGVFYLGGLIVALPLLQRDVASGSLWVLTAMGVTFSNDTGAYFVGRAIGRHKLAPAISPGKTIEGLFGGLAASVSFAFVARATYFPSLSVLDAVVAGVGASVVGPAGDLVESLIKRSAGVKDSGKLIPGHGGMMDRIDALLFTGAWVFVQARFFH